jgi:hypothetical protein
MTLPPRTYPSATRLAFSTTSPAHAVTITGDITERDQLALFEQVIEVWEADPAHYNLTIKLTRRNGKRTGGLIVNLHGSDYLSRRDSWKAMQALIPARIDLTDYRGEDGEIRSFTLAEANQANYDKKLEQFSVQT